MFVTDNFILGKDLEMEVYVSQFVLKCELYIVSSTNQQKAEDLILSQVFLFFFLFRKTITTISLVTSHLSAEKYNVPLLR